MSAKQQESQGRVRVVAHSVKDLPAVQETWVQPLGQKDLPEKEMTVFLPGESHEQRMVSRLQSWCHMTQ